MKSLIILVFTSMIAINAYANEPKYCKPTFKFPINTTKYFPESAKSAKAAFKGLCGALKNEKSISEESLDVLFIKFHGTLQKEAAHKMPDLISSLGLFNSPLLEYEHLKVTGMIPDVIFPSSPQDREIYVQATGSGKNHYKHKLPSVEAKNCYENTPCRNNLIAYKDILRTVYNPLKIEPVELSEKVITIKDKEWKKFMDEARSQTSFDIAATSTLYDWLYDKREHDFQSPPEVQWFFLHPSVLIENVSGAVDGQQVQESLALEIIGFNYWKDKCFGFACGASLIVNYADRAGVDDTRWGIMLHIDNSYSFGITMEGLDARNQGFFVTVDLLKLFQNKKTSLNNYKEKFSSIQ